jgi:hypothetical protein
VAEHAIVNLIDDVIVCSVAVEPIAAMIAYSPPQRF